MFPEQGLFLPSCRRICLMLWGNESDEFVLRKVELAATQALQDITNYLIFDYEPSEEYKEVIRGKSETPDLEIRVQTCMLILFQWWWDENIWAGYPDPNILTPTDSIYAEEQEVDAYRKWVEDGRRMLEARKKEQDQKRRS